MPSIEDLLKNGVNHYSYYQPEKPADAEQGDVSRGFEKAMRQIPQTAGGAVALVGDVVGSEGMKEYGLGVYNRQEEEIQKITKPSDSFSSVLEGDGNLPDFLQSGLGYVGGQALTALATGGFGGFIGAQLAKQGAKQAIASGVAQQVAAQAVKRGAMAGAGTAMFGSNLMQEAGSIYPEALKVAEEDGRGGVLSGSDLARVAGSAVVAAGVDTAADALMFKGIAGGRKAGQGIVNAAVRQVPAAMAREGGTELVQTGIERFGAQQELGSADAMRDYVDSTAMGVLGGGVGGAASILRSQKQPDTGPLSRAANAGLEEEAQQQETLRLENKPLGMYAFPDGTMGDENAVNAYVKTIPNPDEREQRRREIMGLDLETGKPLLSDFQSRQKIKKYSADHSPMSMEQAEDYLQAAAYQNKTQGKKSDIAIVPHASGTGFVLVPHSALSINELANAIGAAREYKDAQSLQKQKAKESQHGPAPEMQGDVPAPQQPRSPANPRYDVPTQPAGSFGAVDEFGQLVQQEKGDVAQRRAQLAQQHADMIEQDRLLRESLLESTDNRVGNADYRRSLNDRAMLLDTVLADPAIRNPLEKFRADLQRAGYSRDAIHPDEEARIQRHAELTEAFNQPDVIPAAPNEMPVESLVKERKPKGPAGQPKPKEVASAELNDAADRVLGGTDGQVSGGGAADVPGLGGDAQPATELRGSGAGVLPGQPGATGAGGPSAELILTAAGAPFKAKVAAINKQRALGAEKHDVVQVEGGWAVKPKEPVSANGSQIAEESAKVGTSESALAVEGGESTTKQGRSVIDEIVALEEDAGEGFKKNDRAIAAIKKAAKGMSPQAKARVTRTLNKFTAKQKDGTMLIKPGFYNQVAEDFAYVYPMLGDALDETKAPAKVADSGNPLTTSAVDSQKTLEMNNKPAGELPKPEAWRKNFFKARAYAKSLGIDTKDKSIYALTEQIDASLADTIDNIDVDRMRKNLADPEYVAALTEQIYDQVEAQTGKRPSPAENPPVAAEQKAEPEAVASSNDSQVAEPEAPAKAPAEAAKQEQAAEAKMEAPAKPAKGIADFGQKIAGARKDLWTGFKDKLGEELPSDAKDITLSKYFPEPDYEGMIAEGTDVRVLAAIKAMRDEIPSKPKMAYKLRVWGEQVKSLREFAGQLLKGEREVGRVIEQMRNTGRALTKFADRIEMYSALGYPLFKQARDYSITSATYNMFKGVDYPQGLKKFQIEQNGRTLAYYDTEPEALEALRKKLQTLPEGSGSTVKLDLYRTSEGDIIIGKKVASGKYIDLKKGFTDVRAARAYLKDNEESLLKELERKKEVRPERRSVNDPRVGKDRRMGEDVPPEKFAATFGFRGIQFGNYVEQARRVKDLNNAYDALLDLADIINIPERAISLNGELGLAFGARGTGGVSPAAATYESGQVVINLTKRDGAGSLAHEWFHALDNYFSRKRGDKGEFITNSPRQKVLRGPDRTLVKDESIRPELLAAFEGVVDAIKKSGLQKRSREMDKTRSKDYWGTTIEMAARAFESYIIDKAAERGQSNDYLANIMSEEGHNVLNEMTGDTAAFPYPIKSEKPAINAAFDKLFATIEAKPTEDGDVMLGRGSSADQVDPFDRALLVDIATGKSTNEVLARIAAESANPQYRELAKSLMAANLKTTIEFGDSTGQRFAVGGIAASKFAAGYKPKADQVLLFMPKGAETSVLHELTHAATFKAIRSGGLAARQMTDLYRHVEQTGVMKGLYAMENLDEFVAEAFSNPQVQGLLRDITAMPSGSSFKNAWDKFVAIVRGILGLKNANALDQVMRAGADLMAENKAIRTSEQEAMVGRSTEQAGETVLGRAIGDAIKNVTVTDVLHSAGNKLKDFRSLGLQALGRRQLVDIYAADFKPDGQDSILQQYSDLVQRMDADKNESGAEADSIADRWGKLKDERQLADLMHDATLAQIDPAKKYVAGDVRSQYDALKTRFAALSPEAQAVYTESRDMYAAHYAKVKDEIKARITRAMPDNATRATMLTKMDAEFFKSIKGVYFPLARHGDYLVTVKDASGNTLSVSSAETLNEAEATRKALLAQFPGQTVSKVIKRAEFNAARDSVSRGFLKQLFGVFDQYDAGAELQEMVNQLYLSSMPDLSWTKHGIHRKGTPGFSQDARRAFAKNMFHGARYLAKLKYSDRMTDKLDELQKHVDSKATVADYDSVKAQQVVDEVIKRHDSYISPQTSNLSTTLTSVGYLFYMGLSPASAAVNLTGTPLVAYPILGGKYGFSKAGKALLAASRLTVANKNDISAGLTGDRLAAYKEAVNSGLIDVTMAHDLAGIAAGNDAQMGGAMRTTMKWASFMFHHIEKFNRQATFIAAYDLAREQGMPHDAAYKSAVEDTYASHFDYSSGNRPRIMQGNVARVVLLFRQYGQNMIYTLTRNAIKAAKGDKVAQRTLAGLLVSHAMGAGVLGLPIVGLLLSAASAIGSEDDEPWDARIALRNVMADMIGKKPAEVMMHGLSRLGPWDISGRVGLDKLLLPDIQEGLEGQRAAEAWAMAALGPVAGIGAGVAKGMADIGKGDYQRGLENMLPVALRNGVKALRLHQEGVRDKTGVAILDETTATEEIGQLLGFSPSRSREAYEGKGAIYGADQALQRRRQSLMSQFAQARMSGDDEGAQEIREDINAFNQKNPSRRITGPNLVASLRARNRRIEDASQGIYLPKKRRAVMEAGEFAAEDED